MSNLVRKVIIERTSRDGHWSCLQIKYVVSNREVEGVVIHDCWKCNIDDAFTLVLNVFMRRSSKYLQNINLDKLKYDILLRFYQMEEIELNCNTCVQKILFLVPESHVSCKTNGNEDSAILTSGKNEICQPEVQQKLSTVDNDSEVMKFFEDNKCSVCLSQ